MSVPPPPPPPRQDFHQSLHSLLLWLAHADSRRYAVDISHPDTPLEALQQHRSTLTVGGYHHASQASAALPFFQGGGVVICCFLQDLREELQCRLRRQASLHSLWSQFQAGEEAEDGGEAQEKLHVTGSKLKLLLRQVEQDLGVLEQRLVSVEGRAAAAAVGVKMDGACRSNLEEKM